MNQVTFPEVTHNISRPRFSTVPVHIANENPDTKKGLVKYVSKYELSEVELAQILKTGCIFVQQFGNGGYHNTIVQVESPFLVCKVIYEPEGELYNLTIPFENGEVTLLKHIALENIVDTVLATVPNITAEQILFFRQPGLEIGEDGVLKFIKK